MIEPLLLLCAKHVESNPELPVLAVLETALDMTLLALSTWLPEVSDPDYEDSLSPDIRTARNLASRIEALRRAALDYRHTLTIFDDPEHPFAQCQEPPLDADDPDT